MSVRDQVQARARELSLRSLKSVGRWVDDASLRVAGADELRVAEADELRVAGANESRYASLWNPADTAEALAQIYNTSEESSFEEGGRWDFERLAPLLHKSSVVLDFGCGIGRVARYVAPECEKLWAIDVSPRMLELAAERLSAYPNVEYALCKDVSIPDVPTGSIDVVYSFLVLQHVEREDAFLLLEELHRVLRPTGTALLTFPNLLSDTYLDCFRTYAHSGASTQTNRARLYTPQEVERIMVAAGFDPKIEAETEIRVTATLR